MGQCCRGHLRAGPASADDGDVHAPGQAVPQGGDVGEGVQGQLRAGPRQTDRFGAGRQDGPVERQLAGRGRHDPLGQSQTGRPHSRADVHAQAVEFGRDLLILRQKRDGAGVSELPEPGATAGGGSAAAGDDDVAQHRHRSVLAERLARREDDRDVDEARDLTALPLRLGGVRVQPELRDPLEELGDRDRGLDPDQGARRCSGGYRRRARGAGSADGPGSGCPGKGTPCGPGSRRAATCRPSGPS